MPARSNNNLAIDVAVLEEKITNLTNKVEDLEKSITKLQTELQTVTSIANKWQGGVVVILLLGSVAGFALTFLSNIWKYIHG